MPRQGSDRAARRAPHTTARRVAPASVRAGLIALLCAALVLIAGGGVGFWVCLPGLLLAASLGESAAAAAWFALPVLILGLLAAGTQGHSAPALWEVLLVCAASTAVVHAVARRLALERDALAEAAFSDPLTGLSNRRMLMEMAAYEIARHYRARAPFVVVMLDLDGFKQVNDLHGHEAGDRLLIEVAQALSGALRTQDTIARFGGDEFCVIAPETDNPRALAEKILSAVASVTAGHRALSTSVGLAVFPDDGTDINDLIHVADERLLAAKRRLYSRAARRAA